jgi:hypothetical protein
MDKWSALGVRLESFYTQPSKCMHALNIKFFFKYQPSLTGFYSHQLPGSCPQLHSRARKEELAELAGAYLAELPAGAATVIVDGTNILQVGPGHLTHCPRRMPFG